MDGEDTVISEMDGRGRGRNTHTHTHHQEGGEKDGFPVAGPQTAAAELDDARGGGG